ncbi:hypothetical protein GWK36_00110 [Caldichromatium japonicum]|uniref:Uncharacterized protein n=1 Tax=Caldichromatium japonicum TaxID=2699430 RepID=A0A6G7V9W3_9GAMM|nr:hypothetical protein [Caldichromatium japonicum]QIK36665.1 hypothetical protein GWK36_00110 [Caldichromatium japonicum]
MAELFRARGLPVHQVMRRLTALDDQQRFLNRINLLAIDNGAAVGVECKLNTTVEDVCTHLARPDHFKRNFPHFSDMQRFGTIAAMQFEEGIYVLGQSGETIALLNPPAFKPRVW